MINNFVINATRLYNLSTISQSDCIILVLLVSGTANNNSYIFVSKC